MNLLFPSPGDTLAVIAKLAGESCNINCHYCYEKRKPYESATRLSEETLERFLGLCGGRPLRFVLHGGEPLLIGRPHMRRLLRTLRRYDGPVSVAMQTNGVLLTKEWLDLFDEELDGIDISISLDGDRESNAHRVDYRDRPTYDSVCRALDLMAELGRPCAGIMVVTRLSLGRAPESMDEFARHPAIVNVKLSPCLDYDVVTKPQPRGNRMSLQLLNPTGRGKPGWATTPQEYTDFVVEAATVWRDRGYWRSFLLEPVVSIVRTLAGGQVDFTHFSDKKEPFVVALYPDGRIGTSDELPMPDGYLGHVSEEVSIDDLVAYRTAPELEGRLARILALCEQCTHVRECRGGSLADRLRYEGTALAEEYCSARRALIDGVAQVTA